MLWIVLASVDIVWTGRLLTLNIFEVVVMEMLLDTTGMFNLVETVWIWLFLFWVLDFVVVELKVLVVELKVLVVELVILLSSDVVV